MSGRAIRTVALLIVAAALVARCDDETPEEKAPAQKQPWERRPAGADEYLASTRAAATRAAAAATTRATTVPAPRASTRSIAATRRIDSLTDPGQTVAYMFEQMKKDNLEEVRELLLDPPTSYELRQIFANAIKGFGRGATVTVIDQKDFASVAMVIYQSKGSHEDDNDTAWFLLHRRFNRWKILLDPPNPKRLAPEERKNFMDTMEWGTKRMQQILAAATQPTSQSSTQPAPWALPAAAPTPVPIQ